MMVPADIWGWALMIASLHLGLSKDRVDPETEELVKNCQKSAIVVSNYHSDFNLLTTNNILELPLFEVSDSLLVTRNPSRMDF